jgi:hypothetical protein
VDFPWSMWAMMLKFRILVMMSRDFYLSKAKPKKKSI